MCVTKKFRITRWLTLPALLCTLLVQPVDAAETAAPRPIPIAAHGAHGMVASVHPLATEAGLRVLRQGGNAVDAAAAVGLTLGVVDGQNSGIGGGCFILIRRADGSVVAIDGREMAPAAATRDMYLRNGRADTTLSQVGALASGVPGALAAYEYAARNFGKKPFADSLRSAAELAEQGFTVDAHYARAVAGSRAELAQFPASRAVFLKADGSGPQPGERFRQPDLAATYRHLAEQGTGWFYGGPFADAVEKWMRANGGLMTAADLRGYHVVLRDAVRTSYRGWNLLTFPPPSSGGVHVTEILNILEHFDLKPMAEIDRVQVVAEAMKLAFADRAYWLGDPDFVGVPRGLVDKKYAAELAARMDPRKTSAVAGHGWPPGWQDDQFRKHTTHFSVADADGNWVACTTTVNTGFGSKVVVPGTGVVLNNQMDDFSTQPGVANYFGLVGAEANAIAPGKRPLSCMSPTIVLRDGQPILALGAAGGPTIISQVVLALVGVLDLGLPIEAAIAQPRWHHQWSPDELTIEPALPAAVQAELAQRGQHLVYRNSMGVTQIVGREPGGTGFVGVADPRAGGNAAGW